MTYLRCAGQRVYRKGCIQEHDTFPFQLCNLALLGGSASSSEGHVQLRCVLRVTVAHGVAGVRRLVADFPLCLQLLLRMGQPRLGSALHLQGSAP
jgi:hypothetical protein